MRCRCRWGVGCSTSACGCRQARRASRDPPARRAGHQFGCFVHREGTSFAALDTGSVGVARPAGGLRECVRALVLARCWRRDSARAIDVVAYHLAECLRLRRSRAWQLPRLRWDIPAAQLPGVVWRAHARRRRAAAHRRPRGGDRRFRSMARVLTDTLLAGQVDGALAFYRATGRRAATRFTRCSWRYARNRRRRFEYLQEPRTTVRAREASRAPASATNLARNVLRDFYCSPVGDTALNRYEIWERGGAVGDSVTPSIYCPEYRMHMCSRSCRCRGHTNACSRSAAARVRGGRPARPRAAVQAIDCNEEAVVLAAAKASTRSPPTFTRYRRAILPASAWSTPMPDRPPVSSRYRTQRLLRDAACAEAGAGELVGTVERRAGPAGRGVVPHGKVQGFWLFSPEYLRDAAQRFGLHRHRIVQLPLRAADDRPAQPDDLYRAQRMTTRRRHDELPPIPDAVCHHRIPRLFSYLCE